MRWTSYRLKGVPAVGILDGDSVVPLIGISWIGRDTGIDELRRAQPDFENAVALSDVELLPASWRPEKVFCVGLNYDEHIRETGRELPTYPVLFPKFASNLIAADRPIEVPPESSQVDYEGELAVVIGRAGRRISVDEAMDHVLGFTVANDVTMRDYQYKTHQWLQGKAWDACTPVGPAIVSADEIDLRHCGIRTQLNGITVQNSDLSHLIFDVPTLISSVSEFTMLQPGDLILTGTPGGVGYRQNPQVFLTPGSVVSVEIEGIGRINSKVVAAPISAGPPAL